MKVVLMTFGTRGDVQPFLGLAVQLMKEGHEPVLATSSIFESWANSLNVPFHALPVPDPKEAFAWCVEKGFFNLNFIKEAPKYARMIPELSQSIYDLVLKEKADIVCTTFTTAYVGVHLQEKLGIPSAILSYIPYGPTKYFFHPYAPSFLRASGCKPHYRNLWSHYMIDYVYGKILAPFINTWRQSLGLPKIRGHFDWESFQHAPVICGYSPSFFPAPPDWPNTHRVTGYWWLDDDGGDPKTEETKNKITEFLKKGDKPVYIGFGSVPFQTEESINKLTRLVMDAAHKCGERCIIATGWGAIKPKPEDLNENILVIEAVPHYWMFQQVKAIVHHGGAGTVGYALRAGVPSVIVPFFGDHHLWAARLHEMGAGPRPIAHSDITPDLLAQSIIQCCTDESMSQKVSDIAQNMAQEEGAKHAVELLKELVENDGKWKESPVTESNNLKRPSYFGAYM